MQNRIRTPDVAYEIRLCIVEFIITKPCGKSPHNRCKWVAVIIVEEWDDASVDFLFELGETLRRRCTTTVHGRVSYNIYLY